MRIEVAHFVTRDKCSVFESVLPRSSTPIGPRRIQSPSSFERDNKGRSKFDLENREIGAPPIVETRHRCFGCPNRHRQSQLSSRYGRHDRPSTKTQIHPPTDGRRRDRLHLLPYSRSR